MSEAKHLATSLSLDEINFRLPAFIADPYPFYARLRSDDPVHFSPDMGVWWATRHVDCMAGLNDNRLGRNVVEGAAPSLPGQYSNRQGLPPSMLFRDPPDHTRLRALVNKAFTPRVAERLRPQIEQTAARLLDRAAEWGQMDVVADFASPLPATIIAAMLGVPQADQEQFRVWSTLSARGLDSSQPPEVLEQAMAANVALVQYFADLVTERRGHPQPDLTSELIAVEEQGDRLTTGELLTTLVLLLAAGHETTTHLISGGLLALLEHPEQLALLRAQPELLPTAVEELLRFTAPVQRTGRMAQQDLEIGGKLIRRGQMVHFLYGAANRDPEVFERPEELDITRQHNPHLAFGRGIHFCLGAPLARLEAQIAFGALLEHFPRLQLATAEPVWSPNTTIRGLTALPVTF